MTYAPAARREGKGAVPWYNSLRFRLVAAAVVIELVMLGVLVANSYRLVTEALESQTSTRLEALTPLLNASLAGYLFQRDHSEINGVLKELVTSRVTDIRYIVVLDNRQRIVASVGSVDAAKVATLPIDTNVREALRDLVYDTRIDLTLPGNTVGNAHVGLSLVGMASLRDNVLRQSLMIAGVELLLSLLLLSSGGWLITRHLTRLLGATRAIAQGNYGQRIAIPGKDEIGLLADDFNVMTDAVQTRMADLHASQEELRASESLLSKSQEIAHIGSWSLDLTTDNLYWSDEVYRIFGCKPQEFAATYQAFLEFTHPDDRAAVDETYSRSVSEGSDNYEIEHRILRQGTGEIRHVHERCVHVRDAAGAIIQSIGMVQDITERRRVSEALRASEDRYRTLFSEMQSSFAYSEIICDAQGRPINSRYLAVNPAFERITGRKAEDVVGKTILEVFPALEPEWIETFGRVALTGEPARFEMSAAELGMTFDVAAFCPAANHYACTFNDITARKVAEAEQRRLFEQVERDRRALVSTLEDQRRTEETLRESEERFRRAVTGAPFPIMIHAEDGQIFTINTPWTRLTGYEHNDIPTIADWTRKAYGTQMDPVRAYIDGLYALDGPKAEGEYTITTSSGDSCIWDFSSAPIGKMPDGRRLVISMAMDVTERKQLEIERQKFFLLAESSSEFIGMCDLDMQPLYVNPAGRRIVGLPDMATACRVKVQDYYFPEDQRFIAEEFFPRVLREGHGEVEIRLRHFQTGEPIWMFYYLFCVHDASGTPLGWATVSRDITERRQAEESFKTYAERLKNLHRIDQAILQAIDTPEKITQEAILLVRDLLHCQRVSVGMFDFEKKEVRVFAATGDADSVVQTGQVLPEELYGELVILQENRLEIFEDTSNMETVPDILKAIQAEGVRSSINAPISSPKGLIGALNIGWDTSRTITPEEQEIVSEVASQIAITSEQARLLQETKRHAEELEEKVHLRTAQLEATNKELEVFSYSVSHDLRAPLRHISGYVDLLNNRFREALPEKAGHYLNQVTDSASQMGTLIDDLLQFSRTGRQELRQADLDMSTIVKEAIEKLKPDTKNRNISWTVAELPRVYGDYSLLQQVWINLLDNAVKYTQYKDQATIEVGFTREPGQWEFFVRDNGVGFDMQYAHKLFGVFQRLHSPAQFEGTGIGLANVQRIVLRHGGRVRAEGRPDEGATFYFTLPAKTFANGGPS